jgi:phosphotriesterase-related protein
VAEVQTCVAAGVRTMVDAMPAGSGRNPEKLSRISILSGIRMVAATGLHTEKYYVDVPWAGAETSEQLAERFVSDIEVGIDRDDYLGEKIDRTKLRAGIVKVAASTEALSGRDQRLFEAGAMTNLRTGAPVLTHTEGGLGGLAQIETLIGYGVPADRIALSHTDKVSDQGYHRALLETGVYLCYDQGLREGASTMTLIEAMAREGWGERLLVGTDGARRSLWSTLGGSPGLDSLYRSVTSSLDDNTVRQIFVENPARFLSLSR